MPVVPNVMVRQSPALCFPAGYVDLPTWLAVDSTDIPVNISLPCIRVLVDAIIGIQLQDLNFRQRVLACARLKRVFVCGSHHWQSASSWKSAKQGKRPVEFLPRWSRQTGRCARCGFCFMARLEQNKKSLASWSLEISFSEPELCNSSISLSAPEVCNRSTESDVLKACRALLPHGARVFLHVN